MSKRRLGLSTIAIHGQPHKRPDWTPVSTPIYQSSTFTNPVGSDETVMYTRYGNNPNQTTLATRYALLEGAEAAIFVGSGMGATALAHLAVLRPGDHLVSSSWIYGGTKRLFDEELARFGIEVTYVPPDQPRLWKKSCRKSTRALFVETPTNPLMRVLDLTPMSRVAEEFGLALLVDATFASPINFRPLEHGADIVITSATKYLNGHSDVIAGAVAASTSIIDEVTRLMTLWGQAIDPHAAWLIERGMRTLGVRMARHNENGMAVAQWADGHAGIAKVHYPGLSTHPDHTFATQVLDGYGGMVALEIKGGVRATEKFLKKLKIITHAPSLAGVESLISEPRLTSHSRMTAEERARIGIPDGVVRLSCGLEDAADLVADLEQALG